MLTEDKATYHRTQETQADEITHRIGILVFQNAARTSSKKILHMFGLHGHVLEHIDDILDMLTNLCGVSIILVDILVSLNAYQVSPYTSIVAIFLNVARAVGNVYL